MPTKKKPAKRPVRSPKAPIKTKTPKIGSTTQQKYY